MPTIKKKHIGDKQFGGFTPYGNLTTYRATLQTNAAGAVINADSTAPVAAGDQIVLELLPEGYLLEDAQLIVSAAMTTGITGSLGFVYADGVDSADAPQDDAYFGAGLDLAATGRVRTEADNAPLRLAKPAFLVLTTAGAANAQASRIDVIVHGERMGPN